MTERYGWTIIVLLSFVWLGISGALAYRLNDLQGALEVSNKAALELQNTVVVQRQRIEAQQDDLAVCNSMLPRRRMR